MLVEEYQEIIHVSAEINPKKTVIKEPQPIEKTIEMLKMWGVFNRYKSRSGFKQVNCLFSSLYPTRDLLFIENDIEIIDAILLKLKTSKQEKEQEQYIVLEAYYKGVDLVIDGYDWSQKLTIREIAEYLNLPKSTVANRKKQGESYVVSALANINQLLS